MTHADILDCCNADARENVLAAGIAESDMKCGKLTIQDGINLELAERMWEQRGRTPMEEAEIRDRISLGQDK